MQVGGTLARGVVQWQQVLAIEGIGRAEGGGPRLRGGTASMGEHACDAQTLNHPELKPLGPPSDSANCRLAGLNMRSL